MTKRPVLSGEVQENKSPYTKIGDIAFWENEKTKDKAPDYTGTITKEDGTKLRVSLWVRSQEKKSIQKSL